MANENTKTAALRRKYHVRKKIFGTPERPRLSVFRSNRHIYAQIIDDVAGVTLACAGTMSKGLREQLPRGSGKKAAQAVGEAIAKAAIGVGIKCVCFDRSGYRFHGRVKALAEAQEKPDLFFNEIVWRRKLAIEAVRLTEQEEQPLEDTVVKVYRSAKVVKGGRRFRFGALVVVGDRAGTVGIGYGRPTKFPRRSRKL